MTSCSDDFLKENPTTFVDPTALLVNKQGAETYLLGAYDAVQGTISTGQPNFGNDAANSGWASHWGTMGTDEVVVPGYAGDRKLIYLQQLTPTTGVVQTMWENLYVALNRVNSVVDRVSAMTDAQITPADKAYIVAQARFLRSTINFALVCTWENVPLIKNETTSLSNLEVPQAKPEEVYAFIIEDLKAAEAVLPIEQGKGRVTKGAAQALLGKVYLQMTGFPLNQTDKFALASAKLKEVMDSGVYNLLPNYRDVFTLVNEQSVEMVYAIGMDGPGKNEGGMLGTFYGPNGSTSNGGGFNTCFINHFFADSYDVNDIRLRNNIAKHSANDWTPEEGFSNPASWTVAKNNWKPWKWHASKPNSYANDTPFDNPYIRYADVLLMYAEALNGQNLLTQTVIDNTVNKLRARARTTPTAVPDMVLGTKESNATELLSERRKELCFEGWRRNDLIRFGKYKEAISGITQLGSNAGDPGLNYKDFKIRWPIPNSERKINPKLDQNKDY
ncbi:Starch-binding associating with outer membrane [Flavobacterium flevense]|uniref:Membrane protein n=2 Tax=Flavobacterium flevense TaxID=983 RepID=A0A4Y4AZE0_9FLAO|nr:membrane protein [Flavobacterium flevense]SHM13521.1 Starch-binding associating with outer membrane [Flavobacterium flevense]